MSKSEFTVIVDKCLLVIVTVWSNLKTFKSLLWEEKVENITCMKKKNRAHTKKKKIRVIKIPHFGGSVIAILSANY